MKIIESEIYNRVTYTSVVVELKNEDLVYLTVFESYDENMACSIIEATLVEIDPERKMSEKEKEKIIVFVEEQFRAGLPKVSKGNMTSYRV